ncbi:MAG: hypothetical protein HY077_12040 [Elusimicrobia bacterium]|nr:hypothetical protein [Elusimicrobiota bacterium]
MAKMKAFLGSLLLTLAVVPAGRAFDEVSGTLSARVNDVGQAADDLRDTINNKTISNEAIENRTYGFSNIGIPSAAVGIRFKKYNWHESETPEAKPASVQGILSAGDRALSRSKSVPPPEVTKAQERANGMFGMGKLGFESMEANKAGEYEYSAQSSALGRIDLNDFMKVMAMLVSQDLLYATVAHESRHANDHQDGTLSPDEVKAGEVAAFRTEYEYLETITHNGEEIATAWIKLNDLAERRHSAVVARAADYVFSLLALYRTKGDEKKLKEYVDKMGYQEGSAKTSKTSPFSS